MELQEEKAQSGVSEGRLYIGGEWVDAAEGQTFEYRDPFTGEVVADVAAGGRADAARAVDAAHAAFADWSTTPPAARQAMFLKAADILESRRTRSSPCSRVRPAAPSASRCSRCASFPASSARLRRSRTHRWAR